MEQFLKIKSSKIHGNGIFTEREIRANKEFYYIPTNEVSDAPKLHWAKIEDIGWINDPKVLNWVNHSCEPNAELIMAKNRLLLKSIQNIEKGEEITVDYNLTETGGTQIQCSCKSKKCRRFFLVIR